MKKATIIPMSPMAIHYQEALADFHTSNDEWPGGYRAGDLINGIHGPGVVTTYAYCMGKSRCQKGKIVNGTGIRPGLVSVLFLECGCWWATPEQIRRRD